MTDTITILAYVAILALLMRYGIPLYAQIGRQRTYDRTGGLALVACCYMCAHCVLYATGVGALLWLVAGLLFAHAWTQLQAARTGWHAVNARAVLA